MKLMNLFQIFDPSSFIGMANLMIILVFFSFSLTIISKVKSFKKIVTSSEVGESLGSKETLKFMSLFFFVSMLNILSLIPNSFAPTSQVSLNFPLALIIWLSINFFSSIKKTKHFLSHLVPSGSPKGLIPLMVLIELTSNMIRPITLSVRLTANIVAGHLLISLLEKFVQNSSSFIFSTLLLILETGVAIIQGYVFSVLSYLYFQETK
uniref:ATP synthase subunit a n=1 Tax=Leptotrombidium pallidum TaxID=279272 RepID=Q4W8D6_9ACAR|nr:ATP synthase F0 subunit 6 [Leptotrombidium pallidum]BAD99503.1 ATP synthase subunit 6 [Leptotrombidium pallidum]